MLRGNVEIESAEVYVKKTLKLSDYRAVPK